VNERPVTALVVFDLAGTTVHDGGEVAAAFTGALEAAGVAVGAAALARVRGASKREAIRGFFPDGAAGDRSAEAAYAAFRERLRARLGRGARPVDGAHQAFGALRAAGIKVALNTGFDRETTGFLLDSLGWRDGVADAVVCGDDVAEGRPAPYMIFRAMELTRTASVHQVANVGDTALDLLAGYHAGVRWNIGVLTGAHDAARLADAPHTHLAASVAELPAFRGPGGS
jgi:phosphonatase-like hydrolase